MGKSIVKVYSLSTCDNCRDTINFIAQNGVEFTFVDVDLLEKPERKRELSELKKINPKCTFPTTVIGEKTVVGYDEGMLRDALNL
jgi:glutaredoxin